MRLYNGFVEKAEMYINKSLDYNPDNLYSAYVKAYILYAKNQNLDQTLGLLLAALSKDSTRLDVLQEVAKIYYYKRDFKTSYQYYKKFTEAKEAYNLRIYPAEDAKIGLVFSEVGQTEKSKKIFEDYLQYAENDKSIYKHLSLGVYYSFYNEKEKAIEQMKLFAEQDNYQYWIILFLKIDPLVDNIKDLPEFKRIMKDIESKFWKSHEQMKISLEEKGLL